MLEVGVRVPDCASCSSHYFNFCQLIILRDLDCFLRREVRRSFFLFYDLMLLNKDPNPNKTTLQAFEQNVIPIPKYRRAVRSFLRHLR